MCADLHIHTTASDGTWKPQELPAIAADAGLHVIAITDHDSMNGSSLALAAANHLPVKVIPGVELSTEHDGYEVHILGYGLDESDCHLQSVLQLSQQSRRERLEKMLKKLRRNGIHISREAVTRRVTNGVIGRLHLARAMLDGNYVQSVDEAFVRWLGPGCPAHVPRERLTPQGAIETILGAKGVPVLAHPGLVRNDELIPRFVTAGLAGLEVVHSSHSSKQARHYERLAESMGLLKTGGSDCHGPKGKDQVLLGQFTICRQWVDDLLYAARQVL